MLQLRKEVQSNIVMVATSLVVVLYMVETALILSKYPSDDRTARIAAAFELGVEFDGHTQIEVIEAIIAEEGSAAFVSLPLSVDWRRLQQDEDGLLLPLGGVSKTRTMLGNEGGVYATFKSDRHGFNNPDSEWDSPQVEWLLVGDSFTQGSAVHSGEEIAGKIRATTGSTAINLGISGNGPLIELATLKEYAESLQPKKVLWLYYEGNDFSNLFRESQIPLLMRYMQDNFSQDLMYRQQEIDERLREYMEKEKKRMRGNGYIEWTQLSSIRFQTGFDKIFALPDDHLLVTLFTKILTKAKARTEAWGGTVFCLSSRF